MIRRAVSTSYSSTTSGGASRGAAHGIATKRRTVRTGLPLHDRFFGDDRADRHSTSQPLRGQQNIRLNPFVFTRPHLPGAAHAALHLVADEQDAVAIADRAQVLQVARRRDDVAALSLDRLDENRRDAVGRHLLGEQLLFDPRRAARRAGRLAAAVLAAI